MVRPQKHPDGRIPQGCEQIPVELSDVDKLTGIIADSDIVIYCAGSVRGRNLEDFSVANIKGVKTVLDALERSGNTAFMLLVSSLAASRPDLSDYARSKFEGEQLLRQSSLSQWTILRPPAVYGPGDREMMPILKMIRRGLLAYAGPQHQRLSLLYVHDLVNAISSWLSVPQKCLKETYSIDDGTPGGYDWKAIGEAVNNGKFRMLKLPRVLLESGARINLILSGMLGYSPMFTPGKLQELTQPEWLCDNRLFSAATGWKPTVNLHQGALQLFKTRERKLAV